MNSIVVHYQELALKGKNRPWFLGRLVRNLRRALSDLESSRCARSWAASRCVLGPGATREQVGERIRANVRHRELLVRRPHRARSSTTIDASTILADLADRDVRDVPRVGAPARDKRFPMTSPQVEREIGGRIKEARGWTVDLDDPELTIHVELLTNEAFYFFGKERGPGGLPTGTAGRVACLLSGGIDSPVAAHRMMQRGCTVTFVHFHSYPILSRASQEKARELVQLLTTWQQRSRLYLVPFGEIQQQVVLARARADARRRLSPADAAHRGARLRARGEAQALVTGDVVGQVASQTLENLAVVGQVATLPIFRPLIGMDKEEIMAEAQRLGTYPISIIPDQDCCTLFTPRNPLTRGAARRDRGSGAGAADRRSRRRAPWPSAVDRAVRIPALVGESEASVRAAGVRAAGSSEVHRGSSLSGDRGRRSWTASKRSWETTPALLQHQCKTIPKESLHLPGSRLRRPRRSRSPTGRRACSAACSRCSTPAGWQAPGYVSILPVDQGIEHSAGASFAPNPAYFDPENIVKLAIEGGCNAVASTLGVLGVGARASTRTRFRSS